MFTLGYLDRLALLLGVGLLAGARIVRPKAEGSKVLAALLGANLILPYIQIALALAAERASLRWWLRLTFVPVFFVVDIAAAAWSTLLSVARQPRVWQATERQNREP
jgi:protein-S-isoprenylcysteine O-methyltransferase Ste14